MLVYIHGANATPDSFNYLRKCINEPDRTLSYSCSNSFVDNLRDMHDQLSNETQVTFIAHSLGGVYAWYLADLLGKKCIQGITMSTPYGGSKAANSLRYMAPGSVLFKDIATDSPIIRGVKKIQNPQPWCNIVSTLGHNPWIPEPNDGVVTRYSMRAIKNMFYFDVATNHYEILLNDQVVEIIKRRLAAVDVVRPVV